ncbi:uncharacterized protein C17orf80 homolog [Cololabis saira]|uniref:uncharacterized protein C17orf80 homolog n=1 Tax=Cololabis saira TaxID=129043 RepID=UPI002AD5074D|nr:uncharacterized protein C17orf80 homolog [Cololabis saira]
MSPEVCPFCGKTYKRLKSHLPHCKAAASSKTPPAKQDVPANQASPPQPAAALSDTTAKGKKSPQKSSQKSSAATAAETERGSTVSRPSSASLSSTLLPSSTKRKQKLADQIKTDTLFLSASPSLSPATSKPKKKSLRALIEAAKADQVTEAPLKGPRSVSEKQSPGLRRSEEKKIKTTEDKDAEGRVALLSVDTKSKDSPKKKVSKMKKVISTTQHTSESLNSHTNDSNEGLTARHNFGVDGERGSEDVSASAFFLKSRSADQVKVTLQDVKATLGRANTHRQSSRPSILSNIEVAVSLGSTDLSPVLLPVETQKDAVTVSDRFPSTSTEYEELQSGQKSKQSDSIPLPGPISASASLLSAHASSQVLLAPPAPCTISSSEVWKAAHHRTGLLSISPPLQQFSSPLLHPPAVQTLPGRGGEFQPEVRKQDAAEKPNEGALTQQRLGQVRLRELPDWLAGSTPTHPRDVVEMVQKGWRWYYRRYVDVKKGGVGGLGMLLAGYCVLSYIWSYPHIKLSRWRKYH